MKNALFTLIASGLSFMSIAQEASVEDMTHGFNGVFTAMDGNVYYTYHIKDKPGSNDKATLEALSFNSDLVPIDTVDIEVSRGTSVMTAALNMNTYLFILGDPAKKTITTIAYESKKKELVKKTVQQGLSPDYFSIDHFVAANAAMPEGFVIVTEEHGKKSGYKVEKVDKDMEVRWTKNYTPEKGSWDVIKAFTVMERLVILRKETAGNTTSYSMQTIQADAGDEMMVNRMTGDDERMIVTSLNSDMERSSMSGLYFEKNGKKPEGVFFQFMGPAGDIVKNVKIPMSEISDKVGGHIGSNITSGAYKVYPLDITRGMGKYMAVAELYTGETISGNEKSYTVMDLLLFSWRDMGPESPDTGISIDLKPKAYREAIIAGDLGSKEDIEVAQWLYNQRFFGYRSIYGEGEQRLLYRGNDTTGGRLYSLMLADTANHEPPTEIIHHGEIKKDREKETGKFYFDVAKPWELNRFMYHGVIPKRGNQALYYEYDSPKLTMWISHIL